MFKVYRREQSRREEIANSISHAIALAAALAGSPYLIIRTAQRGDTISVIAAGLFAVTILLLYLTSALYHALPTGKAKRVFYLIEHSAIFLLIAGTYTPFTLGVLRGPWGWTLFGVIWGLAAGGVTMKTLARRRHPILFTILYLLMGWIIVVAVEPLLAGVPPAGLLLLLAGGLSYTAGVIFFVSDSRLRYGHLIWHLFVIGGSTCHYFAVLWFAA
jgi:hemolysin III